MGYYLLDHPNPACPERGDGLSTPCVEWKGTPTKLGYYLRRINGKKVPVHRWSWEQANGRPVRDGFEIHHICCNRGCYNPEHLAEVTHQDNTRYAKGWVLTDGEWYCQRGHHQAGYNLAPHSGGRVRCRPCYNMRAARYRQ